MFRAIEVNTTNDTICFLIEITFDLYVSSNKNRALTALNKKNCSPNVIKKKSVSSKSNSINEHIKNNSLIESLLPKQ